MEYSEDLLNYYENLGENKPDTILADKEFTKRALSEGSPLSLVRAVAKELEPETLNGIVETLSTFERASVFVVLGRKEEAMELYNKVLLNSKDKHIRGKTFTMLGKMKVEADGFEELFKQAISEGYFPAFADWALSLWKLGRTEEAKAIARKGYNHLDPKSAYVLVFLMQEENNGQIDESKKMEISEKVESSGLLDAIYASLRKLSPNPDLALKNEREESIRKIVGLCVLYGIDINLGMREILASSLATDGTNIAAKAAMLREKAYKTYSAGGAAERVNQQ